LKFPQVKTALRNNPYDFRYFFFLWGANRFHNACGDLGIQIADSSRGLSWLCVFGGAGDQSSFMA
jgi:hypothetical protein